MESLLMIEDEKTEISDEAENAPEVAPANEDSSENLSSELNESRWSVITFESCAVSGLTYNEASHWMKMLAEQGLSGLCIVTDEAANRITN